MPTLLQQRNTLVIGKTAFDPGIKRISFIELGIEVIDVALAHLSRPQIKAPAVIVRLQAHVRQHVRELSFSVGS